MFSVSVIYFEISAVMCIVRGHKHDELIRHKQCITWKNMQFKGLISICRGSKGAPSPGVMANPNRSCTEHFKKPLLNGVLLLGLYFTALPQLVAF